MHSIFCKGTFRNRGVCVHNDVHRGHNQDSTLVFRDGNELGFDLFREGETTSPELAPQVCGFWDIQTNSLATRVLSEEAGKSVRKVFPFARSLTMHSISTHANRAQNRFPTAATLIQDDYNVTVVNWARKQADDMGLPRPQE